MCLTVPFGKLEPGQGRADLAALHTLLHGRWRGQETAEECGWSTLPPLRVTRTARCRRQAQSPPVLWQRLAGAQAPGPRLLSRQRVVLGQHTHAGGRLHTGTPRIGKTIGQKPEAETFDPEMDSVPYAGVGKSKTFP